MTTAWLKRYASDKAMQKTTRTKIMAQMESRESILHSEQQLAIELNLGVDTAKGAFSSKTNVKKDSSTKVAFLLFKQVFYTVSINQPSSPAELLGKTASQESLQDAFTNNEPPGYVHSISYGRMVMVRIEIKSQATNAEVDTLCNYAL